MKLGAYGALRAAVALFPEGLRAWQYPFALLAVIGIIHGALVALVQKDFKFVVGYSSVSHMGFVMLGLVTLNVMGLAGAVFQMFSHGLIAGLLFAVVGRMVYDRTHTRQLDELAGFDLSRRLPFAAGVFVLASMASMGLPGFSGFVAELSVLIGAWQAFPAVALGAGVGIVVGVAYLLRAVQRGFFAKVGDEGSGGTAEPGAGPPGVIEPVSVPERVGAALLLAATLALGLYPRLLLDYILPTAGGIIAGLQPGGRP
jgi:NADH-quinone oxidoreductase subunit M